MNATIEGFARHLVNRAVGDVGAGDPLAKAELEALVARWSACFRLKQTSDNDVHLLPVSGGADSTALAILMHRLFPNTEFHMVFTDTGAEDPSIYETLDALELHLGRSIERVTSGETLFQLIERWGGFLPSPRDRWCTRELKLRSFRAWLSRFDGRHKLMYVGIRRDESQRIAFTIDDVDTEMPFVDMGLVREDVYRILSATIGIPRAYRTRSRSGCSCCPFQTRQELVGLLQYRPAEFQKGARMEKLGQNDEDRHAPAMPLWKDSGVGANWLSLPRPDDGARIEGSNRAGGGLLPDTGIWIGAEFFVDHDLDGTEFTWQQRVVSWSPSLAGIRKQLQGRYEHLLATREVHGMDEYEVRNQVRFAIYFVEAPADVFDVAGPGEGSYTWRGGESYKQLQHVIGWGTRVLQAEHLRCEAEARDRYRETSWMWENSNESVKAIARIEAPVGRLVQSEWFRPAEPKEDEEIDESTVACPMCSL